MPLRFLIDENLHHDIVRALRRERAGIDLITVQEAGFTGISDPELLEVAAEQGRVIVSHDVQTLIGFAYERITAGLAMSGLIIVGTPFQIVLVVQDLLLILDCALDDELAGQVRFVPL